MKTIVKSFCARLCSGTCGIRVTIDGQRISNIQGDSDCPFNRGAICPKGRALPELLYHPDRLTLPLKRIGRKGADQWQPISTDMDINAITNKRISHATLRPSPKEAGP